MAVTTEDACTASRGGRAAEKWRMTMKLIACRVMIDEMRRFLPFEVEAEVFEISQHTRPKRLKTALQAAVDRADGKHDAILLGYGLCSNAVVGLVARKSRMVIPKLHDCIGIFLGSHRAYLEEMAREPAFFLTQGYIRGYTVEQSGPQAEFERIAERYGKEKADKLVGQMMRPYRRLVYIRTSEALDLEGDRKYSHEMAARFGMRYEEMAGTSQLLERMVKGNWNDDFIVVEPGQEIKLEHFMN
jgi:Protein of unknown function (DUF1638)